MVQTFAVFVDGPLTAKIRTPESSVRADSLWAPRQAHAKVKTVKVSSGASGGVFAKVCTRESFQLFGTCLYMCMRFSVFTFLHRNWKCSEDPIIAAHL